MTRDKLANLFERNREWAKGVTDADPGFFDGLAAQQDPDYLWIGCADSRVPATEICGLQPGEMFVHRNIANVVPHTDFNSMSVIHYAVEHLRVDHIIVCGHYGCGGVAAALSNQSLGLLDNWLLNIKDVYAKHRDQLESIEDPTARANRLCEVNVAAQVANVCYTSPVQQAWAQGRSLTVHGWIYGLDNGLLKDLGVCVGANSELPGIYHQDRLSLVPRV